jgi:regulatory protein YycH of two-component signal transduction system YycFG
MPEYIMEIVALIIAVIGVLITLSSGVLIWTFKSQIKRIDNVEGENKEIKENYLDRFEEIKELVNRHSAIMQNELSTVKTDIALIKQKIKIAA